MGKHEPVDKAMDIIKIKIREIITREMDIREETIDNPKIIINLSIIAAMAAEEFMETYLIISIIEVIEAAINGKEAVVAPEIRVMDSGLPPMNK